MIYEITAAEKVETLFDGWEETLIWSCLQGVMGRLYSDDRENPTCAMAHLGDFCFLAGRPNRELAAFCPPGAGEVALLVPQTEAWGALIERCYADRCKKMVRYAIRKEPEVFDTRRLQRFAAGLPEEYRLARIDEPLFEFCKETAWCRDFVALYDSFESYQKHGLGVVALKDGEIVSGASSYSGYLGGIEIQIETKKEYQRKGLATACGARLILECLKKGWYPSWDAHNLWSVGLAEKLGYHFSHEYDAYAVKFEKAARGHEA